MYKCTKCRKKLGFIGYVLQQSEVVRGSLDEEFECMLEYKEIVLCEKCYNKKINPNIFEEIDSES